MRLVIWNCLGYNYNRHYCDMKQFIKAFKRRIYKLGHKIFSAILFYWPECLLNYRTKRFMANKMDNLDHNGLVFRDDLSENLKMILSSEDLAKHNVVDKVSFDIAKCYVAYGITPDEYFLHSFIDKRASYRRTVLSRKHKDDECVKYIGRDIAFYFNQLKDKWEFYSITSPYFKRDVVRVDSGADFSLIESFCIKHPVFIAKPRMASSGIGVQKVDCSRWDSIRSLFVYFCHENDGLWLFEELIEQDPQMAAWHPSSVNTIRIPSIMTKKGPVVILPLFRTGINGNLVDNCHNNGGLMSVPDAKTGVIISDGYDIYTNAIKAHPNSGIIFKGYQIPKWQELIDTAAAVHRSLPSKHKYVGFDFALTKDGWVLVEGNWGNFPHQVCVGYGIRKEFERLMRS